MDWTRIKDQLPPEDVEILIFSENSGELTVGKCIHREGKILIWEFQDDFADSDNFTHWTVVERPSAS